MRMVLSSAHWVDYHTNSQDMYGTVQWTLIGSNSAKPSVNQVLVLRWTSMNWEPHWGSSFYFRRYNGNKFPQSNSCHLFIYKLKCCWGQASNIQFPFDKWSILAFSLQVVKSELTHPKMGTSGCWVIRPLWHSASRAQQQVGSHPFLKRGVPDAWVGRWRCCTRELPLSALVTIESNCDFPFFSDFILFLVDHQEEDRDYLSTSHSPWMEEPFWTSWALTIQACIT